MGWLDIHGLRAGYGFGTVLHDVEFSMDEGSVVAVLGRNGVGKTTFVSSIMGLLPPEQGSVTLDGHPVSCRAPEASARAGIAMVPQGRRLFPPLTVGEHLAMAVRCGAGGAWTIDKVFARLPRLEERTGQRAFSLSGGEQQMLAIARALLLNPKLILLDEPSEGLAPAIVRDVEAIIAEIRASGVSVIIVEQDLRLAFAVADEVAVMEKGQFAHRADTLSFRKNRKLASRLLGVA